jgi:hypothetical protein
MKTLLIVLLLSNVASAESWTIEGKSFESKSQAVRYIVASGKPLEVTHSRCEILTNKLSFKACPKSKASNFENEQFKDIAETK